MTGMGLSPVMHATAALGLKTAQFGRLTVEMA